MKRERRHVPVLLEDVLACLKLRAGAVVVDCTVGLGGHSVEMLRQVGPGGRVIGLDFDPANLATAREAMARVGENFELHHANFAGVAKVLGETKVDGILADLGVASPQIDDPGRGFSYRQAGPLDMRMDPTRGKPASELVNRLSERELREALFELGDEEDAGEIARLVVERRRLAPIVTTRQLVEIVCAARDFTLQRAAGAKLHPAARTFQALRMLVNRELGNLEQLLRVGPALLKSGGRMAIISFHSGEDRMVKQAFRDGFRGGVYSAISEEPIVASAEELARNARSRSAKLRWAQRGDRMIT